MEHRFDRIDQKLDEIRKDLVSVQVQHEQRITRVETRQKSVFTVLSALWVGLSAWVFHKLGLK